MRRFCLFMVALGALALTRPPPGVAQVAWGSGGSDLFNTRAYLSSDDAVNSPNQINPATASRLKVKWSLATAGTVTATPAVEPGGLYVPDWSGAIYKIDPATGAVLWQHQMSDYNGDWTGRSRSSPAIGPTQIVFGDNWAHDKAHSSNPGAMVIAVNKATGALLWKTVVDHTSQWSEILGSPVIYGNLVYVGTASWEEGLSNTAGFVPSLRGSMVALNLTTGAIVWQFFNTLPGYTGASSPGTNPVVWPQTDSLIFSTGNNYTIPASVGACIQGVRGNVQQMDACMAPTNYVDSIVSVDLSTGRLKWARQLGGPDTWTFACASTDPAVHAGCPYGPSNDFDFAQQPSLLTIPGFSGVADDRGGTANGFVLTAAQKSGMVYGLNPTNGGLFWSRYAAGGGIEWGSAINTDDLNAVYVATNNEGHQTNTLAGQNGKTVSWNGGAWTSLNIKTGAINWQMPSVGQDLTNTSAGGSAQGAVTFTNRVVLAGSYSGLFTAHDANSGNLLWTYNSGLPVASGPAVFNETVYWGTGYGAGAGKLFAFTVQ